MENPGQSRAGMRFKPKFEVRKEKKINRRDAEAQRRQNKNVLSSLCLCASVVKKSSRFSSEFRGKRCLSINRVLLGLFFLGLLAVTGCAWYNITPVSTASTADWGGKYQKNGYLVYQPELYFAASVTTTTNADKTVKRDVTVKPIYLPNPTKAYRISTHKIFSKPEFPFILTDGWQLTSIAEKTDNLVIANSVATSLQTILSSVGKMAIETTNGPAVATRVILYQVDYETNGVIKGFIPRPFPED